MRSFPYFFFFISLISFPTFSQNFEKVDYKKDAHYLAVMPKSEEIKGVLLLLPGFGETPENIFPETKIHNVAYLHGILTIALGVGDKICADQSVVAKINEVVGDILKRYKAPKDKFIIGGFSAGGSLSLRYAEMAEENPSLSHIKLKGVFAIDSPVDILDLFRNFEREIEKNFSEAGVGEANYLIALMTKEYGEPKNNLKKYEELTPFHKEKKTPGNEKYLKNLSVRLYHEIDVNWHLKNRRRSIYDNNYLNASELINRLLLSGSTKLNLSSPVGLVIEAMVRGILIPGQLSMKMNLSNG